MKRIKEYLRKQAVEWAEAIVNAHIYIDSEMVYVSQPERVGRAMQFIGKHS